MGGGDWVKIGKIQQKKTKIFGHIILSLGLWSFGLAPPPPPLDPPPLLIWGAKLAKGVRDSAIYKEYSHCKRLKAVIMCFVFTAAQGVVIGECGDG